MGDRTMEIGVMSRTSSRASVVRMISFKLTVSSCQHVSKTVSNVGGMAIGGSGKQEGDTSSFPSTCVSHELVILYCWFCRIACLLVCCCLIVNSSQRMARFQIFRLCLVPGTNVPRAVGKCAMLSVK